MMSRRKFITLCGKLCIALGLSSYFPGIASAAQTADGHPRLTDAAFFRQLVTTDPSHSRILMFQSDKLLKDLHLEYRKTGTPDSRFLPIAYQYLEQESMPQFIYHCELSALLPGSRYEFRILSGERATDWQPVIPVHEESFQMLIFCDSQCVDYDVWKDVAEAACHRHPAAELSTVIGDFTDNGQSFYQWQGWFQGAERLLSSTIFAPVMGNHECYDLKWQMCLPEGYLAYFRHPANGSLRFNEYYYSFDYGPVHFIVLNNQFDELDGIRPGLLREQLAWLQRDAKKNRLPWKVVLMHKDVIHYEYPDPVKGPCYINDIGEAFMGAFDALGIDLVLTGHLHTYRNRHHIFAGKPADRGPAYVLCGLAGDQRYPGIRIDPVFDKVTAPQPETDNYLTLDAASETLRLRCYLPDGTVIDDMTLRKGS